MIFDMLIKISEHLDQKGLHQEANVIDQILKQSADPKHRYLPTGNTRQIDPSSYTSYDDEDRYSFVLESGLQIDLRKPLKPRAAKEVINKVAKSGNVKYRSHVIERHLKRQIKRTEIMTALAGGQIGRPENRGGDWSYHVKTNLGGGFTLVVKIENNKSINIITAYESKDRQYRRHKSQNIVDHNLIPDDQLNVENQGYIGGDGVGGGYSGLHAPMVGQPADDGQNNVDMLAGANGIRGNSVTDDQLAGTFNGLSDAYFYSGYENLEGNYGPQDR